MDKFNNTLNELLIVIKTNYPNQQSMIDSYYQFENPTEKYLLEFIENCKDKGDDISTKNEIIFSKGSIILNNVDFNSIWNDENLEDEQRDNIWKFLHTMYIFAYEHIKEQDFKTIMAELKKLGGNTDSLDEETKTFMNIIDSLTNKYGKEREGEEDEVDDMADKDEGSSSGFPIPDVFGGVIGDLAKEIANEIDPSTLNIEDPSSLLKNLLSGNFDEQNDSTGVVNLVKNITNKIQDKLANGNLDETKLFQEAQNVMKSFGGGKAKGPMKMFNDMMKSGMMGNISPEEQSILRNATMSAMNNPNVESMVNMSKNSRLLAKREKLRKKLEKKQKLLEEKNANNQNKK